MDSTLEFLSAPSARPRIRGVGRNRGARLTADAQISLVILRDVTQTVLSGVFPNLRPGPIRQWTDLQQGFPARQAVMLYFLKIFSRWRLLTPQSGKPNLERFKGLHQGFDFSQLATLCGIFPV